MWQLEGSVQHYGWGSAEALPRFLGEAADGRPWAEVWYGAHPVGPARLAGDGRTLDEAVSAESRRLLGDAVARTFDNALPYLLKLIAPASPLSLQVHPTREHARESFAAENASGLPLDSELRNYRDDNHKPEMLVALERFEALCGFRTPRRAATILEGLDTTLTRRLHELLVEHPTAHGMRAAFRTLVSPTMRPSPELVAEVARACRERFEAGASPSPRIDRIVASLQEHFPGDGGVAAALLLNPVTLHPGEAMFVPAGAIHAYQSGLAVEVMAASDNVLRAGLTSKRVDAEEMLQCVSVVAAPPLRVAPERLTEHTLAYYAPVDEFELSMTTLEDPVGSFRRRHHVPGSGPRILLGLDGDLLIETESGRRGLARGQALLIPSADGAMRASGHGRFVQASVP
ncbi:mannose-6-phosphate isomerase, class I [Brachybacterium muris]|uniref:mannose-6-phosphate isomerase n=1 Tax=Brachybacterium muris UCD-AY4 TaxID=1249481 RepID=A0A022KSV2_9MICO|nr:mannose-6-phosphate isomerase, class I [Brachybacterium muris]EYT48750.1 mannose-6-phosphate isomerase [Brachybacterium muris UCD-AY4]